MLFVLISPLPPEHDSLHVLPSIARAAAAAVTELARSRSSTASDDFSYAVFVLDVDNHDLPSITVGVF